MNPLDPAAGLDAEPTKCKWCGVTFYCDPMRRRRSYCGDECRKAAAAARERARVDDLRGHGLCPRCKRPH